jgi:DNA-binding XRE family transcriptional regulator
LHKGGVITNMKNKNADFINLSQNTTSEKEENNPDTDKKNSNEGINNPKQDTSTINQRLLIAIKLKGYPTISKFARDIGYTENYLYMIINGKYKPTIVTAERICKRLGLGLTDVFDISNLKIPELDNILGRKNEKED